MAKIINLSTIGNNTKVKYGNKIIGSIKKINDEHFEATLKGSKLPLADFVTMKEAALALHKATMAARLPINTDALMPILNNSELRDSLINLYDRWQEEKQFEDWKDYAKIITDRFEALGAKVLKTRKGSFSAVVQLPNMDPITIFLKFKGNGCCLATKAA